MTCYSRYSMFGYPVDGEPMEHSSSSDEPSVMYYVNDGVYGSFNCLLYDHATVAVNVLKVQQFEQHLCLLAY